MRKNSKKISSDEIKERQNEPEFLKIQYSARVCYNLAEKYNHITCVACVLSMLFVLVPDNWCNAIRNGVPFALEFIAAICFGISTSNVAWAARLRKYFDAKVLQICADQFDDSEHRSITEKTESITTKRREEYETQIRNTGYEMPPGVKDWYEFSSTLNGTRAQFECQKQNIWWNKKMLKGRIIVTLALGVFVFVVFTTCIYKMQSSILNIVLCSAGFILKLVERICENIKYLRVSERIDGAVQIIGDVPPEAQIIKLQSLIDERRSLNVLELNFFHKKVAAKLSALYRKLL